MLTEKGDNYYIHRAYVLCDKNVKYMKKCI